MNNQLSAIILLCLCQLMSCQTKQTLKIYPFIADSNIAKDMEKVYIGDEHRLSGWANHYFSRYAENTEDTTVWCALSEKKDTLFVTSTHLSSSKAIPLDNTPMHIESVYYHNHDSIFIFYDRRITKQKTETGANMDFILIDGTGKKIRSYSLDGIPNIHNGKSQTNVLSLFPLSDIPDRMIDGKMLLYFGSSNPSVIEPGYSTSHPKLVALYDLKTGKSQMLNILIPFEMTEKKYDRAQNLSWIRKSKDGNLIVGFKCSPCAFKYDMQKDTMVLMSKHFSKTFLNVDSSSMKKKHDYMSFDFEMPRWAPAYSCYFRNIIIMHCDEYRPYTQILEMLDTNFDHIAYLVGNKEYETPHLCPGGKLLTHNKTSHRPHYVSLAKKTQRISRKKWAETSLEKLPESKNQKNVINCMDYLQKMHLQEGSLVLIINLKYPCGHCLEYLFSTMEQHKEEYAAHNIYYITYDPDYSTLTEELLKRYHLKDSKNILQDNELLGKVYLLDKFMDEGQYYLIDYRSIDTERIRVMPMDFSELQPIFKSWSKQQMEKK